MYLEPVQHVILTCFHVDAKSYCSVARIICMLYEMIVTDQKREMIHQLHVDDLLVYLLETIRQVHVHDLLVYILAATRSFVLTDPLVQTSRKHSLLTNDGMHLRKYTHSTSTNTSRHPYMRRVLLLLITVIAFEDSLENKVGCNIPTE